MQFCYGCPRKQMYSAFIWGLYLLFKPRRTKVRGGKTYMFMLSGCHLSGEYGDHSRLTEHTPG